MRLINIQYSLASLNIIGWKCASSESPLWGGERAVRPSGWVIPDGGPTPALRATPPLEGIFLGGL